MLLLLLPFLAAADGGVSDDAATSHPEQLCPDAGLATMISGLLLDQRGIQALELKGLESSPSDTGLQVRSFRSMRRVAVQLEFAGRTSLHGKTAKARLSGPHHQTVKVVEVMEVTPDSEGGVTRIIVEAEAEPQEARGIYTLELQDAEGTRLLVLPGVRFPSI